MTGPIWRLVPILAGLLLVLTYLLVQGASPDPGRAERTLQALHALVLNDAALHRDVLEARAGLLPSYDPLVEAISGLHGAIDTLQIGASGESGAGFEQHVRALAAEVSEQEALTEAFKSNNALLQNSLTYFTHASREFGQEMGNGQATVAREVGELVNAMLRFMREPRGDAAGEVSAALERLDDLPERRPDIGTLMAHARIIVNVLPNVDAAWADSWRALRPSGRGCCRTRISTITGGSKPAPRCFGFFSTSHPSCCWPTWATCFSDCGRTPGLWPSARARCRSA
jgi:hypothetical protein